jgi:hypothetical protein
MQTSAKANQKTFNFFSCWSLMLLISMLPNILFTKLTGSIPAWLWETKIMFLGLVVLVSFFWRRLRPLRVFALLLLTFYGSEELLSNISASSIWRPQSAFVREMLNIQVRKIISALLVIGLMTLLGYRRPDIFLVKGDLKAPIKPVPWLGFPESDPWTQFGGQWALYISLGLLVFLIIGGSPSLPAFRKALPLLPAVLMFAALNAFSEEVTFRATVIGSLEDAVGPRNALWIAAAFFGIAHFFGVPYGIVGVIMSTFLGWMLGKAMLETRGFVWAWLIHFLQDVLIFSFMAAGSLTPGG